MIAVDALIPTVYNCIIPSMEVLSLQVIINFNRIVHLMQDSGINTYPVLLYIAWMSPQLFLHQNLP